MTVEGAGRREAYGFGPLDVHAPEAHFRFEDVTTVPPLLGGVPSEVGFAMPTTGAGFGGLGGETGLIAPPIAGAGLATPPNLFCWALAPPSAFWAQADENPVAVMPSTHTSTGPIVALLFMRASHHCVAGSQRSPGRSSSQDSCGIKRLP